MIKPGKFFLITLFLPLIFAAGCSFDRGKEFLTEKDAPPESQSQTESQLHSDHTGDSKSFLEEKKLVVYPEADSSQMVSNYHYEQLSKEDQLLYRQIVAGIESYEAKFPVNTRNTDNVHTVFTAVLMDYPDFFWLTGESTVWEINNGESYELELSFNLEPEEIEKYKSQIAHSVSEFVNTIPDGMDTYSKVKMSYDWVVQSTDYHPESAHNQNIQSVFLYQTSVCAGYAKAFQYLMKTLNIPCIYVTGFAGTEDSWEPHGWNIVNIDGIYAEVDCTWGEPNFSNPEMAGYESILYDYFCVTTAEISRNHKKDSLYTYPECVDSRFDYYKLNHYYFDLYDEASMQQAGWNTINEGLDHTFMKFAAEESYLQAKTALEEENIMEDVAYQKMEWDGLYEYSYSYYFEDNMWIIKIFW